MKRFVACCIFYTPDKKLLLQDREGVSKLGEEWAFFGGGVEEGETPEEAVVREIKEELDYDLDGYTFFHYGERMRGDLEIEAHYYLKEIPNTDGMTVLEGAGMKLFTFAELKDLNLLPIDRIALEKLEKEL